MQGIEIDGIGRVAVRQSDKATRLILKIGKDGAPEVVVPPNANLDRVVPFVTAHKDWIIKTLAKLKKRGAVSVYKHGDKLSAGFALSLADGPRLAAKIGKGVVTITVPQHLHTESEGVQSAIRRCRVECLRIEAEAYIPKRLAEAARQSGLYYRALTITTAQTRWGSCSGSDSICISVHCMRLPAHLIDYVLYHELCHTIHKNHSAQFWALLEKVYPGAGRMDNEMKKYTTLV